MRRTLTALLLLPVLFAGCSVGLPQGVIYPSITLDQSVTDDIPVSRTFAFEGQEVTIEVTVDGSLYAGATAAEKTVTRFGNARENDWIEDYWPAFINEEHQDAFYDSVLAALRQVRDSAGLDADRYAELMTVFVQSLAYKTDPVELEPKFPVETFVDGAGDCDDIRSYDPWVAYNHLTSAELLTENAIGVGVLVLVLLGSLVYDRFFCKYACPMGAFLGLISRFSLFKVRRDAETCIDCKACDKACPVNVKVSEVETVTSPECIDCGECVAACPVADTLAVSAPGKKGLSPVTASVLAVGTFAVMVAAASLIGNVDWTVPTLRDQIESGDTQGAGAGSGTGGSIEGLPFDTALIKGSTPLSEVVEASGIPASVFTQVYGVPESEMGAALKDLKTEYGCSPGEVRAFIEAYVADPTVADTWEVGAFEEEEHE